MILMKRNKEFNCNSKKFVKVFMICKTKSVFVLFVVIFVWKKVVVGGGI